MSQTAMRGWCHSCSLGGWLCCKQCGGSGELSAFESDDEQQPDLMQCPFCDGAGGCPCKTCTPQTYAEALGAAACSWQLSLPPHHQSTAAHQRMEHLLKMLVHRVHLESAGPSAQVGTDQVLTSLERLLMTQEGAADLGSDEAQLRTLRGASRVGLACRSRGRECAALQDLGDFQRLVCERWLSSDTQRGLVGSAAELERLCASPIQRGQQPRRFMEVLACCATLARTAPLALDLGTLSSASGLFGGCEDAIKVRPPPRKRLMAGAGRPEIVRQASG